MSGPNEGNPLRRGVQWPVISEFELTQTWIAWAGTTSLSSHVPKSLFIFPGPSKATPMSPVVT